MPELDVDDEAAWVAGVTARSEDSKRELPMAMRNLEAAQARGRLRYAHQVLLQVIQIKPDYTLVLRGWDGRVITDHARNRTPCYLLDVSDEYDPAKV